MTTYAEVSDLASFLRIDDTTEDPELAVLLEAASRLVDSWCDFTFETVDATETARVFVALRPDLIEVDAIASANDFALATDSSGDNTFDTTWTSSDYQLEPLNQRKAGLSDHPYTQIRAVGSLSFPCSREARVQVTAEWGWTSGTPDAVRTATTLLAKHMHEERNTVGGVAFGEGVARGTGGMSPRVKMLLAPYRRTRVPGA